MFVFLCNTTCVRTSSSAVLVVGCWNILSCAVCPGKIRPNTSGVFLFICARNCWFSRPAVSFFRSWHSTHSCFLQSLLSCFNAAVHVSAQNIRARIDISRSFSYLMINVCTSWAVNCGCVYCTWSNKGNVYKGKTCTLWDISWGFVPTPSPC